MAVDLLIKAGEPTTCRVGHAGPVVHIDWGKYARTITLTPDEAVRLAVAIFRSSQKAERKEKALLPTKREVSQFEENMCGTPTVIQSSGLSAGELSRGKPYEL